MKKYALTGYPLGHSLSPLIHRMIMEQAGIDGVYSLIPVAPGQLAEAVDGVLGGLDGFNVTIPYKVEMLPFLTRIEGHAALFGAVNTVQRETDGLHGYNTDNYGFLTAMERAGLPLQGDVLLCGAGGVARMIAFECAAAGCNLTIAVRHGGEERAEKLASELQEKLGKSAVVCLLDETDKPYHLIVNGTPVGMSPQAEAMPLPEQTVRKAGAVFDTIYNPRKTKLVQTAGHYGIPCAGGMEMLVCQALKAQEIWNGTAVRQLSVEFIAEACYRALEERE